MSVLNKLTDDFKINLKKVLDNKITFSPIYNLEDKKIELPNLERVTKNNIFKILTEIKPFMYYEFSKTLKITGELYDNYLYFNLQDIYECKSIILSRFDDYTENLLTDYESMKESFNNAKIVLPFDFLQSKLFLSFSIECSEQQLTRNPVFICIAECFQYEDSDNPYDIHIQYPDDESVTLGEHGEPQNTQHHVFNLISNISIGKLRYIISNKHKFYLGTKGRNYFYEEELPFSEDYCDYENRLNKLAPEMYYIFSKAKKEIEERKSEWLKLCLFFDWYYEEDNMYLTSEKIFCLDKNKDNFLFSYHHYIDFITFEGNNLFKDEDPQRKIRFMICEKVTLDELEEDYGYVPEPEDESDPGSDYDWEQEMIDDYNAQARLDALEELGNIEYERQVGHVRQAPLQRLFLPIVRENNPDIKPADYFNPNNMFFEEKCVICQARKPEIFLPKCKNVCMCKICFLEYKNNICPICRTTNTEYHLIYSG